MTTSTDSTTRQSTWECTTCGDDTGSSGRGSQCGSCRSEEERERD